MPHPNDATWADAGSVTNNNVLSQTETQYDADGNPIFQIQRDRFHDETATGALNNPSTTPKARVSYVANYYDASNRLTDRVDLGTNGGVSYPRPATPDGPSDTALRTSYGYAADTVQHVALSGTPRGTFTLTVTVGSMSQPTGPVRGCVKASQFLRKGSSVCSRFVRGRI